MPPRVRWISPIVLMAIAPVLLKAGLNRETGLFDFQYYSSRDYGASPQNWAAVQDRRGIMYFANTDGILEFDGGSWRIIPLPKGSGARSLAVDENGNILVGGVGEFGYLQADRSGTLQYVSLTGKLPEADRNFVDVMRVLPTPQGAYFSSRRWLTRINKDGSAKVWHPDSRFGWAFEAADSIYVRTPERGLLKVESDNLVPVAGGGIPEFKQFDVAASLDRKEMALIATPQQIFRLTAAGIVSFPTEADSYLRSNFLYSMQNLPGGEMIVGTRKGGILLLDGNGSVDRIVTHVEGLPGDYVTGIVPDHQGGIWLTHFNGISRFNPGFSHFASDLGSMLSVGRHEGAIYAGTSAGLFRMSTAPKQTPGFERVEGITRSTYVLLPYGKYLLAGASDGVFAVAGMQATKILDTKGPVWDLSASRSDPSLVYAASGDGIFVLRHTSASWEKSGEHMMAGQEFRTIVEDLPGRVWATTKNLVWRVDFRQNPPIAEKFSAGASESWLSVFRIQGRNVFATQTGLKTFSAKDRRLVPDMTFGTWLADGSHDVTNIFQEPGGNIWITGKGYHGLLRKTGASYQWEPMPLLRSHINEIYGLLADPDHIAWAFGPDYVLYRWDSSLAGDPNRDFHPLTRRISVVGSKAVWYGGAGEVPAMRLPYRNNALRFEFAAPFYEDAASVEYQYQLEGSDGEWSAWTHESRKDYTHLPEGDYRFHVRARNPHGRISEESISSFGVLAPWYRTWLAYAVYVIFAGFAVWGIVRFRVRQLEEDKRELEATVAERTVEIRRQRDEIQVQERKSHSLLLNILPAQVADELKTTGAVKPVGFDDVTVCFTDFVGFTLSSEKLPPRDLVDRLNEYFTAFDEIVARYGLEKLKTIGDSYMFVSGLPAPRASHAVDAVLAALEMVEVVKRLAAKSEGTGWNIRVGLHSGPVVAGVVGTRKFAFDIWGNTVNFAARMESSGVPGRVNLSERTCRLTRELIECEGRGQVRIKEGRELTMFLARRPAADFAIRYREEFGLAPVGQAPGLPAAETATAAV